MDKATFQEKEPQVGVESGIADRTQDYGLWNQHNWFNEKHFGEEFKVPVYISISKNRLSVLAFFNCKTSLIGIAFSAFHSRKS